MNPLRPFLFGPAGRRLIIAIAAAPFLALAIRFFAPAAAIGLGLLAAWLLIEAARREQVVSKLAANLAVDGAEPKLEVGSGALGELCRQINRVLQQRRTQHRLLTMLPSPPPAVAARLADLAVPPEGFATHLVVLAIRLPGGSEPTAADLQMVAGEAVRQAALHGALLSRNGNVLVLSFGALGGTADAATRSAYRAAFGLHAAWHELPEAARPALCLTSGMAEALVVPGLGYTMIGAPLNEAVALLATAPADTLHCDEATYVHLRRLGTLTMPLTTTIPALRRQGYHIPFG